MLQFTCQLLNQLYKSEAVSFGFHQFNLERGSARKAKTYSLFAFHDRTPYDTKGLHGPRGTKHRYMATPQKEA